MEIWPPNKVWRPPAILPSTLRERTVMPRTTPRLRTTRKPGRSTLVVIMEGSNIMGVLKPIYAFFGRPPTGGGREEGVRGKCAIFFDCAFAAWCRRARHVRQDKH